MSSKDAPLSFEDLKPDHHKRPLSVFPYSTNALSADHVVLLETFSPMYDEAYNFLVSLAEAETRPTYVHEYRITEESLHIGLSLGYTATEIEIRLGYYSKYRRLPPTLLSALRRLANNQGTISFSIYDSNRFLLRVPQTLDLTPDIKDLLEDASDNVADTLFEELLRKKRNDAAEELQKRELKTHEQGVQSDQSLWYTQSFKIASIPKLKRYFFPLEALTSIRKKLKEMRDPLSGTRSLITIEEYLLLDEGIDAVRNEQVQRLQSLMAAEINTEAEMCELKKIKEEFAKAYQVKAPQINAQLKPTTDLRDYQDHASKKVISEVQLDTSQIVKRCNSGLVVLPCGAGKSLLGVACACRLGHSCIVVTNGNLSSKQWKSQFLQFSTVESDRVYIFSANKDEETEFIPGYHIVFISTYQMLTNAKSAKSKETLNKVHSLMWGIVLFDEAHQVMAETYRTLFVTDNVNTKANLFLRSYCKIGLTATPLREDDEMTNLYLLGNKLYESNWSDLAKRGFIAKLQCAEIRCPMHHIFYDDWLDQNTAQATNQDRTTVCVNDVMITRKTYMKYLTILNPYKVQTAWYLKEYHTRRGDQVLLFCDTIMAAKMYARMFDVPFIMGACSDDERECLVNAFATRTISCLMLSSVGDTSLDLPDANVIIELDWQERSRRQEAQRMGRISRPKSGDQNAYFYILVSEDTNEQHTAAERRTYLSYNQGYPYSIMNCKEIWETCNLSELFNDCEFTRFDTWKKVRIFYDDVRQAAIEQKLSE